MNAQLEDTLTADFPGLYRLGLDYGFQCGDGWYALIRKLSAKLEPLGVTAMQVKNKWGALRFYLDVGSFSDTEWDTVTDIIDKAEVESETTCVGCGGTAELGGRCGACRDARLAAPWSDR